MLQSDGEPVSQPKTAALKTDKKTLDWINKEDSDNEHTYKSSVELFTGLYRLPIETCTQPTRRALA
jgi:hypothetical protein